MDQVQGRNQSQGLPRVSQPESPDTSQQDGNREKDKKEFKVEIPSQAQENFPRKSQCAVLENLGRGGAQHPDTWHGRHWVGHG